MATIIYRHQMYKGEHLFRTTDNETLCITDFRSGIATADPLLGTTIQQFAKTVAGCFRVKSNFKKELLKAYGCATSSRRKSVFFIGIRFEFNGAEILVTKANASVDAICKQWKEAMDAILEKERLQWEAYMKTPEYRMKRAKELKREVRRETVEKDVVAVDETTELEFKDEEATKRWRQWVEVNSHDFYSNGVVTYARQWAKYMQHLLKKHSKTVDDVANQAKYVCNIGGITGFMYGCAVSILSEVWKYGDDLSRWHNKEYDYEGNEGVLDPAIITFSAN